MNKTQLFIYTPLNPEKTGISDYSEELISYLAKNNRVDIISVIRKGYVPLPKSKLGKIITIDKLHKFNNNRRNLFQIGNNKYHMFMIPILKKESGIVVLHDINLAKLNYLYYKNKFILLAKIIHSHGIFLSFYILKMLYFRLVTRFAVQFRKNDLAIKCVKEFYQNLAKFTMIKEMVNLSKGVIVHNKYAYSYVNKICPQKSIALIRHGIKLSASYDKRKIRKKLKIPLNSFVILSAGFVDKHKKIDYALHAFKQFLKINKGALYIIVGQLSDRFNISSIINNLGVKNNVRLTGYVNFSAFNDYIRASDICINLRHYGTQGETSGSLLRMMSLGKPVLISNFNQYSEYPNNTCVKIGLGSHKEEINWIYNAIVRLYQHPDKRKKIGGSAKKYIRKFHGWHKITKEYVEFVSKCYNQTYRL